MISKINILVVVVLFFIACNNTPIKDHTILKGTIKNVDSRELQISNDDDFFDYSIGLDDNGSFTDTLSLEDGKYTLFDGENSVVLYIGKGNEMELKYDFVDFSNTLTIIGEGSKMASYFIEKEKRTKMTNDEINVLFALEEDIFKRKIDSVKASIMALVPHSPWISKNFIAKEKRSIHYAYLSKLSQYQQRHRYTTEKSDYRVSNNFLAELEGMLYDNIEDYRYTLDYKNLVARHYGEKAKVFREQDSLGFDESFFKVCKIIENENIRNNYLYDNMRYMMYWTEDVHKAYRSFMDISTNADHTNVITEIYDALLKVSKGNSSPKFFDYKHHDGTMKSLDDFKGKYVYIDIWATWCAPCKREIPFLQQIERKYHQKNIAFVSISVDKVRDFDKWKKMVVDMGLTGTQLFADDDFNSEFIKDYAIKSIPRFILIDPDGLIVDSNAPRPSSNKLIELLEEIEL